MTERSELSQRRKIVAKLNEGAPRARSVFLHYSRIEDPDLRVSLRTGDLISAAAASMGLALPHERPNDDWVHSSHDTVMKGLASEEPMKVREVLAKAAELAARDADLNGDHEAVFGKLAELLGELERPGETSIGGSDSTSNVDSSEIALASSSDESRKKAEPSWMKTRNGSSRRGVGDRRFKPGKSNGIGTRSHL